LYESSCHALKTTGKETKLETKRKAKKFSKCKKPVFGMEDWTADYKCFAVLDNTQRKK
jgi:hypothetical protein